MGVVKDITGERFGRLVVLKRAPDHVQASGRHRVRWLCQCDCGNQTVANGDTLKAGGQVSCGCYNRERARETHLTHGESETRLYSIWLAMKRRCDAPNTTHYADYGGRGICVCEEWRGSYENFRSWAVESGYDDTLSIDRVDTNGNYTPENCRWVGSVVQANNRRSNRRVTMQGETHTVTEWARILGKNPKTVFSRIYTGWPEEKALTT